jgi:hypothetical protein
MHFYGISASLESINGIPKECHSPREVFHKPTLSFTMFKNRLENHFKSETAAPIMIDDGSYAYNIVGIGCDGSNTTLWIANPHIKEGVNRFSLGNAPIGLYLITLDSDGKQMRCSLHDEHQYQKNHMNNADSYRLQFNEKPWMILFPTRKQ